MSKLISYRSGMVTEADHEKWNAADLKPYVQVKCVKPLKSFLNPVFTRSNAAAALWLLVESVT